MPHNQATRSINWKFAAVKLNAITSNVSIQVPAVSTLKIGTAFLDMLVLQYTLLIPRLWFQTGRLQI